MTGYLIYDCEIIKCIPTKGVRFDGYEYCAGWHDHANMGISVIGYQWLHEDEPQYTFTPKDFSDLAADALVIGFNSRGFDDKLMAANGCPIETDYDLLVEVRMAAIGSPRWRDTPKGFSYSLNALAQANGMAKTGNGALAPQLWQDGKHQEVIDYCCHDVKITVALLKLGLAGQLVDLNTNELIQLAPLPIGRNAE